MGAKEIVKRLKDSLDYEFDLSFNERKELLSYIEQLENKNKENSLLLIEFQDMEQRIEQLENNRDKAIKILGNYKHYSTPTEEQNRENEEIVDNAYNILKGDSDEK